MRPAKLSIEDQFLRELEIFRGEAETALQFLYAESAIHARASEDPQFLAALRNAPLLWATILGGLQTGLFIVLRRIFDKGGGHNIHRLLALAEDNASELFSLDALHRRKRAHRVSEDTWENYRIGVYEPKQSDFARLRRHVTRWGAVFNTSYWEISSRVFAHKVHASPTEFSKLFKKTNIRELEHLCVSLKKFHLTLRELVDNGWKPVLRPLSLSVANIRREQRQTFAHERIVYEVFQLLALVGTDMDEPPSHRVGWRLE